MFISDTYRFSEDESGTIRLQLTRAVAQDVSVTINGGRLDWTCSVHSMQRLIRNQFRSSFHACV